MDPKTNRGAKEAKQQTLREMARTIEEFEVIDDFELYSAAFNRLDLEGTFERVIMVGRYGKYVSNNVYYMTKRIQLPNLCD